MSSLQIFFEKTIFPWIKNSYVGPSPTIDFYDALDRALGEGVSTEIPTIHKAAGNVVAFQFNIKGISEQADIILTFLFAYPLVITSIQLVKNDVALFTDVDTDGVAINNPRGFCHNAVLKWVASTVNQNRFLTM